MNPAQNASPAPTGSTTTVSGMPGWATVVIRVVSVRCERAARAELGHDDRGTEVDRRAHER